jgi:hypothetical protein
MYITEIYPREKRLETLQDNLELLEQKLVGERADTEHEYQRRCVAEHERAEAGVGATVLRRELEQIRNDLQLAQRQLYDYHSGLTIIAGMMIVYLVYSFIRPNLSLENGDRTEL